MTAEAHDRGEPSWSALANIREAVADHLMYADPEVTLACSRCTGGEPRRYAPNRG
jgi:hypothetical protein